MPGGSVSQIATPGTAEYITAVAPPASPHYTAADRLDDRAARLQRLTTPSDAQVCTSTADFTERFPGLSPEKVQRALERLDKLDAQAEQIRLCVQEIVKAASAVLVRSASTRQSQVEVSSGRAGTAVPRGCAAVRASFRSTAPVTHSGQLHGRSR
jgi:hypothetical protein